MDWNYALFDAGCRGSEACLGGLWMAEMQGCLAGIYVQLTH